LHKEDDFHPILEDMTMRTFGTILVAVIFASAAGCGGGSGSKKSPTGRDPALGGMCPASSGGKTCTGEKEYADCLTAACGAQAKACIGANYAQGDFSGSPCADFMTCEMACPCDATGDACVMNCASLHVTPVPACLACAMPMQSCLASAACELPKCTTTGTPTSTSTNTSTGTGANCKALQTCCASMPSTVAPSCQAALTSAGGVEASCAAVLQGFQGAGYCGGAATTTTTTTATSTATNTATGAQCAAAQACCASLPAALTPTCQNAITSAAGVETACAAIVTGYQSAGYCGGAATTTATTTATSTATTTATGANCAAAQACCASLPAALTPTCQNAITSAAGVETACAAIVTGYQSAGYCGGAATTTATTTATGTGCAALQACCASLPAPTSTACQSALTSAGGVDSTCTTLLQQFQAAGLCK
jgi:hypothetical protein